MPHCLAAYIQSLFSDFWHFWHSYIIQRFNEMCLHLIHWLMGEPERARPSEFDFARGRYIYIVRSFGPLRAPC